MLKQRRNETNHPSNTRRFRVREATDRTHDSPSCSDTPTPHPLQSELEGRTLRREENIRRVMRAIEKERGSIDPTEPPSYERWRYTLVAMGSIKIISSCLLLDKLIKLFKFCYYF